MSVTDIADLRYTQAEHDEMIEDLAGALLQGPAVDCPVVDRFAKGVYCREVFMPAGSMIIGHKHKTEHFNIVLTGKARVLMGSNVVDIEAPDIFVSKPGVRKTLLILEDMRWATIHPTEETDMEIIEKETIEKSPTLSEHKELLEEAFHKLEVEA